MSFNIEAVGTLSHVMLFLAHLVTHSARTSEEDTAASFEHYGREALPFREDQGKQVRLILGSAWAHQGAEQCSSAYPTTSIKEQ